MISHDEIKQLLTSINEDLSSEDLDNVTKLSEQGVESLDTFDLFLRIEEDYGVTISDEEIENLDTIEKIVNQINR